MTTMNMKPLQSQFVKKMSSISDVSAVTGGSDSDNLEPSQGFYSTSAPASGEFISPNLSIQPQDLEPTRIRRLSLERFVAEISDPNDERVSPLRAPTRTVSTNVLKSVSKSVKNMLAPTKAKGSSIGGKYQNGSTKQAPMMPTRKASFIG